MLWQLCVTALLHSVIIGWNDGALKQYDKGRKCKQRENKHLFWNIFSIHCLLLKGIVAAQSLPHSNKFDSTMWWGLFLILTIILLSRRLLFSGLSQKMSPLYLSRLWKIACALISIRLNYCSAVFARLPKKDDPYSAAHSEGALLE